MEEKIQISNRILLRHQTPADPGEDTQVHQVLVRRHGAGVAPVGHGNQGCQERETVVRKLSRY